MYTFEELDGRWYCLEARRPGEDTNSDFMVRWLTEAEAAALREARAAGLGDVETFLRVFPDQRERLEKPRARAGIPSAVVGRFAQVDGKVFAVMNATADGTAEDAAVWRPLSVEEARTYQKRRARGDADTTIFRDLFASALPSAAPTLVAPTPAAPVTPPTPAAAAAPRTVKIEVTSLTKEQLLRLVEAKLGTKLPSLERSTREDLERLLLSLPE